MKKSIIAMAFIIIVFSLVSCSTNKTEEVIIETNVGAITEENLINELQKRYGKYVLQELVTIEVLGEKYGIDEKQINDEMEKLKEEYGTQFGLVIQQQGFEDEESFRPFVHLRLLREAAALDNVEVTDDEIEEAYKRKTKEINAQHILVQDEVTAKDVIKKLDRGDDFGELAKEFSVDNMSADEGGDLGYFSAGKMVPPFENIAFSMEPNEISGPVETNYGYHIIKVNDVRKKESGIGSFEEREEDLREEILENKMNMEATQMKIDEMVREAIVDVKNEMYEGLFERPGDGTP